MVICKANLSRRLREQLKLIFSARRSLGRWILMETFFSFFFCFSLSSPPFREYMKITKLNYQNYLMLVPMRAVREDVPVPWFSPVIWMMISKLNISPDIRFISHQARLITRSNSSSNDIYTQLRSKYPSVSFNFWAHAFPFLFIISAR